MDSEHEVIDEKAGTSLVISHSVQRAAGDVVHQAFERLLSSDLNVERAQALQVGSPLQRGDRRAA